MGNKHRDVEVIPLAGGQSLVVACDSCGAVGSKDLDEVHVPPYVVGRLTARVALFEVMAVGAVPSAASAAICNEPSPTGDEILRGVREELGGLRSGDIPIAISTEKNMVTRQTAVGVTVMGVCPDRDLRIALSRPGDDVCCLGLPRLGAEVAGPDDDGAVRARHLAALLSREGVHDIIPVGSKGIRREAKALADAAGLRLLLQPHPGPDLDKSAGPATCIVFTCLPGTELSGFGALPLARIGGLQ